MNAQKLIDSLDFVMETKKEGRTVVEGSKGGIYYTIYPNEGYYLWNCPYTGEFAGGALE